jgi:hypothetical protein
MFVLGHLGIGGRLCRRVTERGGRAWLLAGTVLPDLVDKPLYYGLVLATGRRAAELGLVSGTRTFGHTLAATLAVLAVALVARRRAALMLALGMLTHLGLDELGDVINLGLPAASHGGTSGPPTLAAILFPLLGWHFPVMPFHDAREHLGSIRNYYVLGGELIGGLLLVLEWRRRRRRS